ncbi:prepilin-type N-terminal cleavage/methylation domain-containing protein [bacterium]|nr:prepilin-type N-terminal cleavage/methylation domain-containing protein [bacterium]
MCNSTPTTHTRSGFTLIELLVVVSILLILMTMTVAAVNFTLNDEKVGSAARQVQSFLEGARSRAIRAKEPRGVRFFIDGDFGTGTGANGFVTTMAYVAPGEEWSEGNIRLERAVPGGDANIIAGAWDSFWWELYYRGQLHAGIRVKIPNSPSGSWYTITLLDPPATGSTTFATTTLATAKAYAPNNPYPLKMQIVPPYRDPATNPDNELVAFSDGGPSTYLLELPSRIQPRQPVLLPDGTVIDLLSSRTPGVDYAAFGGTPYFDVMFSPRGTVIGSSASSGLLHLYICELATSQTFRETPLAAAFQNVPADDLPLDEDDDGVLDGPPWVTEPVGNRSLVSIFTQTGNISSHPVDPTDIGEDLNGNGSLDPGEDVNGNNTLDGPDGLADDPYRYAETAEVAK